MWCAHKPTSAASMDFKRRYSWTHRFLSTLREFTMIFWFEFQTNCLVHTYLNRYITITVFEYFYQDGIWVYRAHSLLIMEYGVSSNGKVTSSNENIFRVTGPLWGESTGQPLIPLTKSSDVKLWCFLWSAPENKRLSKQSRRLWFDTPSCLLCMLSL